MNKNQIDSYSKIFKYNLKNINNKFMKTKSIEKSIIIINSIIDDILNDIDYLYLFIDLLYRNKPEEFNYDFNIMLAFNRDRAIEILIYAANLYTDKNINEMAYFILKKIGYFKHFSTERLFIPRCPFCGLRLNKIEKDKMFTFRMRAKIKCRRCGYIYSCGTYRIAIYFIVCLSFTILIKLIGLEEYAYFISMLFALIFFIIIKNLYIIDKGEG